RTLSMGGLVTAQYYHFFLHNPYTYWSHLKIVSSFVHYPYHYGIGQEIGIAYSGSIDLNATAHFYATDGIAAAGLTGILVIGAVSGVLFWVLDCVAQNCDIEFAAVVTAYAAFNLSN